MQTMLRLNLSDKRFGKLLAIRSRSIKGRTYWLCKCDCGETTVVDLGNLIYRDGTKSCRECYKSEVKGEKNHFFGKHHTLKSKEKMRFEHLGNPSNETSFKKGQIPWNKGLKGKQIAWNKGKPLFCRQGKKHPMWNGGISFLPYPPEFNGKLKCLIRERDGNQCQNPDCEGSSPLLMPHHINYNKNDCRPLNLITLCKSCNGKANTNRQIWERLYQEIARRKAYGRT
jgi:hypothetical protein